MKRTLICQIYKRDFTCQSMVKILCRIRMKVFSSLYCKQDKQSKAIFSLPFQTKQLKRNFATFFLRLAVFLFASFCLTPFYKVYAQRAANSQANQVEQQTNNNQKKLPEPLKKDEAFQKEQAELEKDFDRIFSENPSDPVEEQLRQGRVSWWAQVMKIFIGLLLIIGFFYLLMRLYRFQQKLPTRYSEVVKVHHQYPLATGKQIQILEIGRRLLVVGVSEAGIQLLTEINEKSEVDAIKLQSLQFEQSSRPDFLTELSKAVKNSWQEKVGGAEKKSVSFMQRSVSEAEAEAEVSQAFDSLRRSSQQRLERLKRERQNFNRGNEEQ